MSLKEILETAQSVALSEKLVPNELSIWHKYCRIFSQKFNEPLSQVLLMDSEYVLTQIFSSQLDDLDLSDTDHVQNVYDAIMSLSDPDYDAKKEKALREADQKMVEEERQRLKEGHAVHKSLEKDKLKFVKERPQKELPKSGGLNTNIIQQLQNEDKEG